LRYKEFKQDMVKYLRP